jgi:hypothetical protein
MNETEYFRNLRDVPLLPKILVLADVVNSCDGCPLPNGSMYKTADEAQALFPPQTDPSLTHPPPFNYPIKVAKGSIDAPKNPQSSTWPVDNKAPNNPYYFLFFVATDVTLNYSNMATSTGK